MLRFTFYFFFMLFVFLLGDFISGDRMTKFSLCFVFFLSAFFTTFTYLNEILKILSDTRKNEKNSYNIKNPLVSFNDAVAEEIMRMRSDLISIKINQNNLGWDKINTDFLRMFWTCSSYPSSFLCGYLNTPKDYSRDAESYQGKIIILLDNDINIGDDLDIKFDSETLAKINASKKHQIKTGQHIELFVAEAGDQYSVYKRYASILSIKEDKNSWETRRYTITLKINLETNLDFFNTSFEKEEKYIIREIVIIEEQCSFFIHDDNLFIEKIA